MKTFAPILLCASLGLALGACTPSPDSLFAEGEAAFETHDYRTARLQLERGLDQQADNVDMQILLARTFLKLGEGERASLTIQALAPELRDQARIRLLQGEADILQGRHDAALDGLEGIESAGADRLRGLAYIGKSEPENAGESFELGLRREAPSPLLFATSARFELERGQWRRADDLSDEALKRDPQLVEGMLVRADLLERRNMLVESKQAFTDVLAVDAGNFDARLGLGRVMAAMGMEQEALDMAARLQAEAPDSLPVATIRASIAAQKNDWEAVRAVLQPFEAGLPGQPDAAILYSEAMIELALPGQALIYLAPQFDRQPQWRALRVLYARALQQNGEAEEAMAVLRPLAERPEASPAELQLVATIAEDAGDPDAPRFEQRAVKASPEWVGAQIARADKALRNRQWAQAEARYLEIIAQIGPGNAMILNNLAFAQGELGKSKEALKHALAAVEMAPANASVLDTAGALLIANGERERGKALLEKALGLDPGNAAIKRHLADAEAG